MDFSVSHKYRKYIFYFFIPLLLCIPLGVVNYFFLNSAGEISALEEITEKQANNDALYGTAIHHNVYSYKMELYKRYKPDIVIIGSSRVLQFRKNNFNNSMVNLGRTVNYPLEAEKLIDDILDISKPEIVIFGVDFWWANPRWPHAFNFDTHKILGGNLSPQSLIAPLKWLFSGKYSLEFYIDMVLGRKNIKVQKMIGLQALLYGNGFSSDGSYYYQGTLYGEQPPEDPMFNDTLNRIRQDRAQFKYGNELDENRLGQLKNVIDKLKKENIEVITLMLPLAPKIYSSILENNAKFSYIQMIREKMYEISSMHYDFTDPASLNATDCEFIDGFHGGDVVSARMLRNIFENSDDMVRKYLNITNILEIIENFSGKATADVFYKNKNKVEIDFLSLGCKK